MSPIKAAQGSLVGGVEHRAASGCPHLPLAHPGALPCMTRSQKSRGPQLALRCLVLLWAAVGCWALLWCCWRLAVLLCRAMSTWEAPNSSSQHPAIESHPTPRPPRQTGHFSSSQSRLSPRLAIAPVDTALPRFSLPSSIARARTPYECANEVATIRCRAAKLSARMFGLRSHHRPPNPVCRHHDLARSLLELPPSSLPLPPSVAAFDA